MEEKKVVKGKVLHDVGKTFMSLAVIFGVIFATFYVTKSYYVEMNEESRIHLEGIIKARVYELDYTVERKDAIIKNMQKDIDSLYAKTSSLSEDLNIALAINEMHEQEQVSLIDVRGRYTYPDSVIKVYGFGLDTPEVMSIAYHEIGHHFWYNELTKNEQEEYVQIYENATEWVTEYAETSAVEDFAETFLYHILTKCQIGRFGDGGLMQRQEFMEKVGVNDAIEISLGSYCK
jgi:hypothetical protein